MSEDARKPAFDPYHRWLGIRPEEQPPNHYRLLGLSLFEDDPEAIRDAALRQMAHVRTYQLGAHAAISQKILNALGAAKACLLDRQKKAEYDHRLRAESDPIGIQQPQTNAPADDPQFDFIKSSPKVGRGHPLKRKQPPWLVPVAVGAGVLVCFGVMAIVLTRGKGGSDQARQSPRTTNREEGASGSIAPRKPLKNEGTSASNGKEVTAQLVSGGQETVNVGPEFVVRGTTPSPNPSQTATASPIPNPPSAIPSPAIAPFDAAKAREHQAAWARYLNVPAEITNSIGMKLVLIPPGEFMMGSSKELIDEESRLYNDDHWYRDRVPSEGPQHRVRISRPYRLGLTDVTQEQYQGVMSSNPSKFQGDPKRPVEQVSWDDAVEFCRRLSELPGEKAVKRRYGLPTEAQWEHACRAGTMTRWYSGDDGAKLVDVAWFKTNAGDKTHPVGEKKPNAWGLYDMHGNVWQWCQDWYDDGYYAKSPTDDPVGPSGGSHRAYRGGSWINPARSCRSANRSDHEPAYRHHYLGFRVSEVLADETRGGTPEKAQGTATTSAPKTPGPQEIAKVGSGQGSDQHLVFKFDDKAFAEKYWEWNDDWIMGNDGGKAPKGPKSFLRTRHSYAGNLKISMDFSFGGARFTNTGGCWITVWGKKLTISNRPGGLRAQVLIQREGDEIVFVLNGKTERIPLEPEAGSKPTIIDVHWRSRTAQCRQIEITAQEMFPVK